jgi:hypothetical protein
LTDDSIGEDVFQVAGDIGGLHATSGTTPYLSLFSRLKSFKRESLDVELNEKRLAKVRCIRGTMYIMPTDSYPATFSALRRTLKLKPNRCKQYLGITLEEYEKLSKSIVDIVDSKGMTAPEAKKVLGAYTNISRVMGQMCDEGLLARGMPKAGWAGNTYTYYPFSDYFPGPALDGVPEPEAIVSLVDCYLAAFGPATEDDIAWWTGLPKKRVKEALSELQGQIVNVDIPELKGDFRMLRSDEQKFRTIKALRKPAVSLLPVLDPYTMGYKGRDRFLDPTYYNSVYDRSGNGTSVILVNGMLDGIWDFARVPEPSILLCPFEEFQKDELSKIYAKARSMGRFIAGRDCKVKEVDRAEKEVWNFMSPLKGDASGAH